MPKRTRKVKLNIRNVNDVIGFHKGIGLPFLMTVTNFTMFIESNTVKIHFLKNPRGRRFFAAYNKIKSDLNGMPIYINDKLIKYYNLGNIYDGLYADKIYQVDIKSCYASILFNDGLISKGTYEYIGSLPKELRLSSVGMMASKKSIFQFDDKGEVSSHTTDKSIYSDYFFYCVQKTYKIMQEVKHLLGEDYLFSWVDAVYFKDETNKDKVMAFFADRYKLASSFSEFLEFEIELIRDFYRLRYIKNGRKTHMNIPCIETEEKKAMLKYLLNTKLK